MTAHEHTIDFLLTLLKSLPNDRFTGPKVKALRYGTLRAIRRELLREAEKRGIIV